MPTSPSADSILQAARRALAEGGPERLTISAVARAAGTSRPTVYRWFPTKRELLLAVQAYEEAQFDIGLQLVVDSHRTPRRQLDAALRYLVTYLAESLLPDSITAEPTFALEGLARSLSPHIEILARLLGPALDEVPAVNSGLLSREQAAEVFLRLAYSHYVVPHADAEELLTIVRGFAGLTNRRVTART